MKISRRVANILVLTVVFAIIMSLSTLSLAAVAVGENNKPQKVSLGSFYSVTGPSLDVTNDANGNFVQTLNSTWTNEVGQLVRTVGFGANLKQAPYLILKVKSADFPFQLLFRYTGGEFDDANRTFLMIQNGAQISATEKVYVFDLRNYFRTDRANNTEVTTPYSDSAGMVATRNIAIVNEFKECSINFVAVPASPGNSVGDKVVVSNIYLSPTADTTGNVANYNKVPAGAVRIPNTAIIGNPLPAPAPVFNGDNTISLTAATGTAHPMIVQLDEIDINARPILLVDFKSSPTGTFMDFVGTPSPRIFSSITHPLTNFVVAIDLRNLYVNSDNKVLYLYNWNGSSQSSSTMVINGIYTTTEVPSAVTGNPTPTVGADTTTTPGPTDSTTDSQADDGNVATGDSMPIVLVVILVSALGLSASLLMRRTSTAKH